MLIMSLFLMVSLLGYTTWHFGHESVQKDTQLQYKQQKLQEVDTSKQLLETKKENLEQKLETEYVPKQQHDEELKQKDAEIEKIKLSKAQQKAQQAQLASVIVTKTPPATTPAAPAVVGDHGAVMAAAGIAASDMGYASYIIGKESTWNTHATNRSSGAYGLCQSLPAGKMASAGADWQTNPITQLKWCQQYAFERYGSWLKAYQFWLANQWW